jgi:exodeoxyribonuclease V beta subunit
LLREVDATPLSSEAHPFTLSEVPANDRLVELEFLLPLKRFTLGALSSVVERHADELPADFSKSIASLDFPPVEGLMRGFIDLVFRARERFWVIDWKSNWLGWSKADYSQPAMAAEMTARLYPLQVLLYALAVDRWLELRMPGYSYERDFGGIHYLFLRGLDASQPGQGVYSLRPSTALLRELGELLLESPGGER